MTEQLKTYFLKHHIVIFLWCKPNCFTYYFFYIPLDLVRALVAYKT